MASGQSVVVPVDLQGGACTTFAIVGASMRRLRARVFDGEGVEVATSAIAGNGALVHLCPEDPAHRSTPHYLVLDVGGGGGAVVAGAFLTRPGEGAGFDGLFEGILDPPVSSDEMEASLAAVARGLRERGMRPVGEPHIEGVGEGGTLRRSVSLEAGRCYVALAFGEGFADVDLFVYDSGGAELARDIGLDARPRVEVCPTQGGEATLEAKAFEGTGALGMAIFEGEPEPRRMPEPSAPPADRFEPMAWLGAHTAELAKRGYGAPWMLVRDAPVQPGETRVHEVLVGPGCVTVIGAGGPGELDLDLYLSEDDGALVDRDVRVARVAAVSACREEAVLFEVRVKAYGRGRYGLARVVAPSGLTNVAALRLEPLMADQGAAGFVTTRSERLRLSAGETQLREFASPRDGCRIVLAAGDEGILDLDLLLRHEDGVLLATDTGTAAWAALRRCQDEPRSQLVLHAYRGEGEVELRWLEGPLP